MRTNPVRFIFLGICSLCISAVFFISPALATSQIKVVATGDSITNTYQYYYPITDAKNYFADTGYDVSFQTIAMPGINSQQYAGHIPWDSTPHDYAQDVADAHPDIILFMLGTNDVFGGEPYWEAYQTCIPEIFSHWTNGPKVIVSSILPQLYFTQNNQQIEELYNPFLKQEAEKFGFIFLDTNALLQAQPNWESYYANAVHLNASPGDYWLAGTMCDAVKARLQPVPEPAVSALLAIAALCYVGYFWRRK